MFGAIIRLEKGCKINEIKAKKYIRMEYRFCEGDRTVGSGRVATIIE